MASVHYRERLHARSGGLNDSDDEGEKDQEDTKTAVDTKH